MPGSTSAPNNVTFGASTQRTDGSSSSVRKGGSRPSRKRVNFVQESVASSDEPSPVKIGREGELDGENIIIDPERMRKICNKLKGPDPWPREFAESIKIRQESITKKLEDFRLKSASDEEEFEAAVSPLIQRALRGLELACDSAASPPSGTAPIHVPFLGAEGQPYCNGLVHLMRQSDDLIFAYDQLSGQELQPSCLQDIKTSFERDKQVAVATLEAGKQIASIDIKRLIYAGQRSARNQ